MNYNVTKKKFIKPVILNLLMVNGNKNTSENLLTKSFKLIQKNTKKDFKLILKSSLKSLSPTVSTLRIKKRKTITTVPFFFNQTKTIDPCNKINIVCFFQKFKQTIFIVSRVASIIKK